MPHTVRDWMSSPVIVVDPDSSVSNAVTLMRRRNIHSLVVGITKENPAYGIITTTDIRDKIDAAVSQKLGLTETPPVKPALAENPASVKSQTA